MPSSLLRHSLRPLRLPPRPPSTSPLCTHLPYLHQFRLQSTTPPNSSPAPSLSASTLGSPHSSKLPLTPPPPPPPKPIVPASEIPLNAQPPADKKPLPTFTPTSIPSQAPPATVAAAVSAAVKAAKEAKAAAAAAAKEAAPSNAALTTINTAARSESKTEGKVKEAKTQFGLVVSSVVRVLRPFTEVIKAYGREQRKRPWITQIWTAVVIYFVADISAQNISGKPYDPERTMRSLIIGVGIAIPGYEWLIFLGSHFNYRSLPLSLAVKCIIAQSFYTPLYNTYFFGMQSLLAGDSWSEIVDRIKATVPTSSINSCKVWPIVTAFSFAFLPIEYRNAFNGLIAIFWQTYLSYLNRGAEEAAEAVGRAHHGLHVADTVKEVIHDGVKKVETVAHVQA